MDRAPENDRPTLLLRLAYEHLLGLRIERPGGTLLERLMRYDDARSDVAGKLAELLGADD